MKKRAERTNDRLVLTIARDILNGMKANTLDEVTSETFKWVRNRKTAVEKEVEAVSNGMHIGPRLIAE